MSRLDIIFPEKRAIPTGADAYGMMVAIDNRKNVDEIMPDGHNKHYTV